MQDHPISHEGCEQNQPGRPENSASEHNPTWNTVETDELDYSVLKKSGRRNCLTPWVAPFKSTAPEELEESAKVDCGQHD